MITLTNMVHLIDALLALIVFSIFADPSITMDCCPDGPQYDFESNDGPLPPQGSLQFGGWEVLDGSPFYAEQGCESSNRSIALPGPGIETNGSHAILSPTQFGDPAELFIEDREYCIRFCLKYEGPSSGQLELYTGETLIGETQSVSQTDGWVGIEMNWIATVTSLDFSIRNSNLPFENPPTLFFDNLCITELSDPFPCNVPYSITEEPCGLVNIINEYQFDKQFYEVTITGPNINPPFVSNSFQTSYQFPGPGEYIITIDAVCFNNETFYAQDTIVIDFPEPPVFSCPANDTLTITEQEDCIYLYEFPFIEVENGTISCFFDNNPVIGGDEIELIPGTYIGECIITSECYDDQDCFWEIVVVCDSIVQPLDSLCGRTVVTCFSGAYNTGQNLNGFVIGIVNNNEWGNQQNGNNWTSASTSIYHHPTWTAQNLGEVFGLAIDDNNNIYTTPSSSYGHYPAGPAGYGGVYKIASDGIISHLVTTGNFTLGDNKIPNDGAGLGNIVYDAIHNQLFVSNFYDGLIYRIESNTGNVLSRLEPFGPVTTNGTPQIANLDQRPWGLGYNHSDGRLYFANWTGSATNAVAITVHSIEILTSGEFDFSSLTLELTLSDYNFHLPVSDIVFSCDNKMLLGQRTMASAYVPGAHQSAIIEYEKISGQWQLTSGHGAIHPKYSIGGFNGKNSAGGVDYGYENIAPGQQPQFLGKSVWASGDYLHSSPPPYIYGMQGWNENGGSSATSVLIDYDNNLSTTQAKRSLGDVEVFKCGCYISEVICDSLSINATKKPNVCVDSSIITGNPCITIYEPVCGCDGNTYANSCVATEAGITTFVPGECDTVDVPDIEDRCCYTFDIKNNWGPEIVELEVEMQGSEWIFNTVQFSPPFTFGSCGSLNQKFCVTNPTAGSFPSGTSSNAFEICFAPIVQNPTENPSVVFRWMEKVGQTDTIEACIDTLSFECINNVIDTCMAIIEPSIICDDENPQHYTLCFDVQNNSGLDAGQITIECLDPGFLFLPNLTQSKIKLPVPNPLPNGTSTTQQICVEIESFVVVAPEDSLCMKMGMIAADGTECCHSPVEICVPIEPCCDPCEENSITASHISMQDDECCYSIDVSNNCVIPYFTKLVAEVLTPGVCFGAHVINPAQVPFWSVSSTNTSICMEPTGGIINDAFYPNLIEFCLDKIDDPIQDFPQVIFKWYAADPGGGPDIVACIDTLTTSCEAPDENICLQVSDQLLECLPDSNKYRYTFTITNRSNPSFTADKLHLLVKNDPDYEATPTGPIIPLVPPLDSGQSRTITTCIEGPAFPASHSEFVFGYRLQDMTTGDCCFESECDTTMIPSCPGISCPPITCDSLDIFILPDPAFPDSCCHLVQIENRWCADSLKGLLIEMILPASISQIEALNGWYIDSLTPNTAVVTPPGAISLGQTNALRICNENINGTFGVSFKWLKDDGSGDCIETCGQSIEINCPFTPQPNQCVQVTSSTIDCQNEMICLQIKNVSFPPFDIGTIQFYNILPAGSIPDNIPLSTPLIHGDSTEICFPYNGLQPNQKISFSVLGQDLNPINSNQCCVDTITHCIDIPDCANCDTPNCDSLDISIIPDPSYVDSCCHIAQITNNYCDTKLKGIKVTTQAPASIAQIEALNGWFINVINPYEAELQSPGFIPMGTQEIFRVCNENFSGIFNIGFVWLMDDGTGNCNEVCQQQIGISCGFPPSSNKCLQIVSDTINCDLSEYCFTVKNNTYPPFSIGAIELNNITPAFSLAPETIVLSPPLNPGEVREICIEYEGVPEGDTICFSLSAHDRDAAQSNPTQCCVDTIKHAFVIPSCQIPNDCCVDSLAFCDLVNMGFQIDVDSNVLTVTTTQFDTCHWFTTTEPDWGDGSRITLGPVSAKDTVQWSHIYDTSGMFNICIEVFEGPSDSEQCWSKEICKMLWIIIAGEENQPRCSISTLEIPNGITPNGDGENDELVILSSDDCGPINIKVFNRWGQLVWNQDDYDNTWSGVTKEGKKLIDGTYYLIVEYHLFDGKFIRDQYKGFLDIRSD